MASSDIRSALESLSSAIAAEPGKAKAKHGPATATIDQGEVPGYRTAGRKHPDRHAAGDGRHGLRPQSGMVFQSRDRIVQRHGDRHACGATRHQSLEA